MTTPETERRHACRVVAFCNQKGGVGKTTTTIHLGTALAEVGQRVLLVDLDPQANLTSTVRAPGDAPYSLVEVLERDRKTKMVVEGSARAAILPTGDGWPETLHVIASGGTDLADHELDMNIGREGRLARAMAGVRDDYDAVLLDLPPALGLLTVNGLVYADEVYVVVTPTRYGLEGAGQVIRTIEQVRTVNADLTLAGVIVNMHRVNTTEAKARVDEVRAKWPGLVTGEPCLAREVITKAGGSTYPLAAYGAEGAEAAQWYRDFASNMMRSWKEAA